MQRDIVRKIFEQAVPLEVELGDGKARLLHQIQSSPAKLQIGRKLHGYRSKYVPSLGPSLVLYEPINQQIPAPGVPRDRAHYRRQFLARRGFITLFTMKPREATHRRRW